ncbi:MAG: glycosyltransferase family 2 protein [Chlorobi bacterium]|nr:glycosyltransferase family 2 protein [Chlorobiota bacterium]MCI0716113.1 glycosyltransferase family 2 protein [Chlorobiota bacterium]
MKISAIIITLNEELNIENAINSVSWCDEIIIVDSDSWDKTVEIARKYTGKIYNIQNRTISEKRNYSIEKAKNEWVLFLDADERISEGLKNEILRLSPDYQTAGYWVKRKNYWFGKWIKHSANYPDYQLKLFNKKKCRVTKRLIHEGVETEGKTLRLENDLLHYSYRDLTHMINKINFFSTLEADEHLKTNKQISKFGVFTHAVSAFLRIYLSNKGFKDGKEGFFVSFCYALTNFLSHLKLLKVQGKI